MATREPRIAFEIVLRTPGSGERPTIHTIDRFRPSADAIAACRGWLEERGVTVYPTDFSLACSCSPAVFESLFSVRLIAADPKPGRSPWRVDGRLKTPPALAQWVEEVTLPPPPEFMPDSPDRS